MSENETSTDLKDGYWRVEDKAAWIQCPHCGGDNVRIQHFSQYDDLCATVDCQDCPANGYFGGGPTPL